MFILNFKSILGIQLLYGSKEQTRWTPVNIPITSAPPPRLPSSNNTSNNQTGQNSYPGMMV